MVGPYSITDGAGLDYSLWAMTLIDPATGWFEVVETKTKTADHIGTLLDRTWFSRYPRPMRCIYDNGNEFLGEKFQEMLDSYEVKGVPTSVKNPQANLVERVNQTLGNMIRLKDIENQRLDPNDPFTDILCSCAWAIRSTVHTTLKASPAQLVFGRDMIFDLSFKVKWRDIMDNRKKRLLTNNESENRLRIDHTYREGDLVLINRDILQRKFLPKRDGPFTIKKVYSNGLCKVQKGAVAQKLSIRRLVPYPLK